MVLTEANLAALLALPKDVVIDPATQWESVNNIHWERIALPILDPAGDEVARLMITASRRMRGRQSFNLFIDGRPALRWDFGAAPHRNVSCPQPRFPAEARTPHEHRFSDAWDMSCAEELDLDAESFTVRLEAFAAAIGVTLNGHLPPPSTGEAVT